MPDMPRCVGVEGDAALISPSAALPSVPVTYATVFLVIPGESVRTVNPISETKLGKQSVQ